MEGGTHGVGCADWALCKNGGGVNIVRRQTFLDKVSSDVRDTLAHPG